MISCVFTLILRTLHSYGDGLFTKEEKIVKAKKTCKDDLESDA